MGLLHRLVVTVLVLAMCLPASRPLHAQQAGADPSAWGVYAGLADSEWKAGAGGWAYRYAWITPGREMGIYVEGRKKPMARVRLGEQPGELVYVDYGMIVPSRFTGKVLADGSVHFEQNILGMKGGFRQRMSPEGVLEMRQFKYEGGQLSEPENLVYRMRRKDGAAVAALAADPPASPPGGSPSEAVPADAEPSIATVQSPGAGAGLAQAVPEDEIARAWGVLAQMAGSRWRGIGNRPLLRELDVAWKVPGQQLVYEALERDGTRNSYTVSLDQKKPGQLRFDGSDKSTATVRPDGSVLREGRVLLLMNHDQLLVARSGNVVDLAVGLAKDGRLYPREGGVRLVRQGEDARQQASIDQEADALALADPAVWADAMLLDGTRWLIAPVGAASPPKVQKYEWIIPGQLMSLATENLGDAGASFGVTVFPNPAGTGLLHMRATSSHKDARPISLDMQTVQREMQPYDGELRRAMVREYEAAVAVAREERAREKKERSERRWEVFNIVLAGVTGGLEMAASDYQQVQQQQRQVDSLRAEAAQAQQAREARQRQQQVRVADLQAAQQQAGREAFARQLSAGIAWRNQQMR